MRRIEECERRKGEGRRIGECERRKGKGGREKNGEGGIGVNEKGAKEKGERGGEGGERENGRRGGKDWLLFETIHIKK